MSDSEDKLPVAISSSFPITTWGYKVHPSPMHWFLGVKRPGREADNSPPSSAED